MPVAALFAIHLPDNVVTDPWWVGGFAVAALLTLDGAWGIRDEEIPRTAVLTAAFFVASLIHVPVPAGPRAHLLLNGLLGVVLGRRAALAIPIGLLLQTALFQHGGFTTLGLNSCIVAIPALLTAALFGGLRRLPGVRRPWFRAILVGASALLFQVSLFSAVALLATNGWGQTETLEITTAASWLRHPATLALILALAALAAWGECRLEHTPEFPVGLLLGETAVLLTVFLNGLVLLLGGLADWHTLVLLTFLVHLPLAVIEGMVLGFTVGFLARVKPELLGWAAEEEPAEPRRSEDGSLERPPGSG
jgi:cobalt/nickel transport system permease protein